MKYKYKRTTSTGEQNINSRGSPFHRRNVPTCENGIGSSAPKPLHERHPLLQHLGPYEKECNTQTFTFLHTGDETRYVVMVWGTFLSEVVKGVFILTTTPNVKCLFDSMHVWKEDVANFLKHLRIAQYPKNGFAVFSFIGVSFQEANKRIFTNHNHVWGQVSSWIWF